MSTYPLKQWLALGKSSMAMFKQLSEAGIAGVREAGQQLPDSQAEAARCMKSLLTMNKEWSDLQAAACTGLLQAQAGLLDTRTVSAAFQNMMALQMDLSHDLSARRKEMLKVMSERTQACVDDLHKARGKDDVSIVMACFLGDVGALLREDAEQTGTLLNSAHAASTVLTHIALDEMIGAPAARPE